MVLTVAPGHPWADGRQLTPSDLAAGRWVMRERGSGTRAILEAAVGGKRLDVAMELASNEAVRSAAEAGAGAAVMSRLVAASSLASGALVEATFALPRRRFFTLRHKERYATKAAAAFLELIREPR
jgi:DNA-binding transcriptional LysR family regulator